MKKRFKWLLKAFSQSGTSNRARPALIVKKRLGFGVLLAALVLILTLFSTAQADDHKTRTITILSSGIKTAATSQSSSFDVSSYTEGQVFVDVTVEASTSTLDITVQTSPDNVTWYTHTAMSQITAIGQYRQAITNFGNYLRIYYTVGGTSFTFSVTGVFKN